MSKKVIIGIGLFIILAVVIGYASYLLAIKQSQKSKTVPPISTTLPPEERVETNIPTKGPADVKRAELAKDYTVEITNQTFSPTELRIPLYNKVTWENKDNQEYVVSGEWLGEMVIKPGESFSQAFGEIGSYSYILKGQPEITGTVIVEQGIQ